MIRVRTDVRTLGRGDFPARPCDAAGGVTISAARCPTAGTGGRLLADFDGNAQVNFDDLFLFAVAFGKPATGISAIFDLDGNGAINLDDFFVFADRFGRKAQ